MKYYYILVVRHIRDVQCTTTPNSLSKKFATQTVPFAEATILNLANNLTSHPKSQPNPKSHPKFPHHRSKMMHMTFYWGTKVTLLFDWWRTESWPSYSLALLICFLISSFYQYMEDRRLQFLALATSPLSQSRPHPSSINSPLLTRRFGGPKLANPARLGTAVLFGVNSGIGYLLMLAVMSYNGGVLIAVVLGLGVGYFLFRAKEYEAVIVDDTCACS